MSVTHLQHCSCIAIPGISVSRYWSHHAPWSWWDCRTHADTMMSLGMARHCQGPIGGKRSYLDTPIWVAKQKHWSLRFLTPRPSKQCGLQCILGAQQLSTARHWIHLLLPRKMHAVIVSVLQSVSDVLSPSVRLPGWHKCSNWIQHWLPLCFC
jgi:hypothetical protein